MMNLAMEEPGGRKQKKIKNNFDLVEMFIAGLNSEGLYRVSGFSDLIEDVKMAFDRGTVFPACWNFVLVC